MRWTSFWCRPVAGAMLVLFSTGFCPAQEKRPPNQGQTSYNAIVDNLDMIIDNYVKFLGRKYELTEDQYQYTLNLVRERAYGFLEKHEPEVRTALEKMFDVRAGGNIQPDELMDWGKKVMPLYDEAKKVIIQSNTDWRSVLTDDQKRKHDADLKEMDNSFKITDEQMGRIVNGQMSVEEFRNPGRPQGAQPPPPPPPQPGKVVTTTPKGSNISNVPQPPPANDQDVARAQKAQANGQGQPPPEPLPPDQNDGQPAQPQEGQVMTPPGQSGEPLMNAPGNPPPGAQPNKPANVDPPTPHNESEWEKYVREFCERFKLNDQQQQQAQLKLKECQEKASQIALGQKSELEAIDQRIVSVGSSNSKDKAKELADLNKQKEKLGEPIKKIFDQQLKPALDKLPTRAQRKEAEAAAAKGPAPKPSASRPSVGAASHPAGKHPR